MQKKENNQTNAALAMQKIIRNNIRMLLARFPQSQSDFAEALGLAQGSVSRKLNGKAEWTSADIANIAEYFGLPFYVLVSPMALKDYLFTDSEAEYRVPHNAAPDISRRGLSAPAGTRYLRKPDGGEDKPHGANGSPRFFVMPETNELALRGEECMALFALAVARQNLWITLNAPTINERP